jgi:hypothetical protein
MRLTGAGSVRMDDTKLLDMALQMFVYFELENPCEVLPDIDDTCAETCKFNSPQKECWRRYLEYLAKEE